MVLSLTVVVGLISSVLLPLQASAQLPLSSPSNTRSYLPRTEYVIVKILFYSSLLQVTSMHQVERASDDAGFAARRTFQHHINTHINTLIHQYIDTCAVLITLSVSQG